MSKEVINICDVTREISSKIWDRMKTKIFENEGNGEVTITEEHIYTTLLNYWRENKSHFVTIKSIEPERKTGADIEWWIREIDDEDGTDNIITLNIQAKRIYRNECYDALCHPGQEDGTYQVDDLIKYASNNNNKMIPLYFFYNWFKDISEKSEAGMKANGWTYALARDIKPHIDKGEKCRKNLEQHMNPVEKLFCSDNIIDNVLNLCGITGYQKNNYIKHEFPEYIKKKFDIREGMDRYNFTAPEAIKEKPTDLDFNITNEDIQNHIDRENPFAQFMIYTLFYKKKILRSE